MVDLVRSEVWLLDVDALLGVLMTAVVLSEVLIAVVYVKAVAVISEVETLEVELTEVGADDAVDTVDVGNVSVE